MGTPRFAGAHGPGPQDRTQRMLQARYRPVPRWLAGTSVVFAMITGLVVIGARGANRQAQPQDTPADADRNVITATVSPHVSTLNVRAVADGTTTVDLGPSAVIGTLEPGDTVRVMCEFTSDETSDGGSDWYRIAGPNVPDTASGTSAVASAGYLAVAPDAAVPSCATRDAGYSTPLTGRTTASSRVSREPPGPSPRA